MKEQSRLIDFWKTINKFWQTILNKGEENFADDILALNDCGVLNDSFLTNYKGCGVIKFSFIVNDQEKGGIYFIFSKQFVNEHVIAEKTKVNCAAMLASTYQTVYDMNPMEGDMKVLTISGLEEQFTLMKQRNKSMFYNAVVLRGYFTAKITTIIDEDLLAYLLERDDTMATENKMDDFFLYTNLQKVVHSFKLNIEQQKAKEPLSVGIANESKTAYYTQLAKEYESNAKFHPPSLLNSIEEGLSIDDDDVYGETLILSFKINLIISLWQHTASYDKEILFRTVDLFFEKVVAIHNPGGIVIVLQCMARLIEVWGEKPRFRDTLARYPEIKEQQGIQGEQQEIIRLYDELMAS